ncbi:hypothetical protein N7517_004793 [Penicillium concentricum]|uniref:Uncharacterized protein n=1 Tax=Penicillium concentricum TaxID=293559 RepID=A0A9W9S671_9EURO|nr:uncharacterized protein N7517_004793 [Penicillium concentricum]KAJ5372787.1 hypothetical protein N7517_004793 [Penicillium concentricum]
MKPLLSSIGLLGGFVLFLSWLWHSYFSSSERSEAIRNQRIIYATYLSAPTDNKECFISEFYNTSDAYFDAARILTYQLLHAPETRTRLDIPFVVFVHQNVDREKRDRLQSDGAQVIEWSDFRVDWFRPTESRWVDALTKLRLWEMVQYDLIVFLDGDSVLTRCLDGLIITSSTWLETATQTSLSFNGVEIPLPETYIAAGLPQLRMNHSSHPSRVPEDYWDWNTLNAGFMILQPSLKMFHYFETLLAVENNFDTSIADQSVLNIALSRWGPTPWTTVDFSWNIQWPWPEDIKTGYAVLHEKWWAPVHWESREYLHSWYWRMRGYYATSGL